MCDAFQRPVSRVTGHLPTAFTPDRIGPVYQPQASEWHPNLLTRFRGAA
jgi:hypothetical protein